eukprot:PhM_4_TR17401/c1_g1_i1/m.82110
MQRGAAQVRLLEQQRVQERVDFVLHVFEQTGVSEADGVLDLLGEVVVAGLDGDKVVLLVHVAHPRVGLALRVDHERPRPCLRQDESVLCTQVVRGEPLQLPLLDLDGVADGRDGVVLLAARYPQRRFRLRPRREQLLAVASGKGTEVSDCTGGQQHVTDDGALLLQVLRREFLPAHLLAAETVDESSGADKLLLREVHLELELLLLLDGRVVLTLQFGDGVLDGLELRTGLVQAGGHDSKLGFGLVELRAEGLHLLVDEVVLVHGVHPLTHGHAGLGGQPDLRGLELGVVDVHLELVDELLVQGLLIVRHERGDEALGIAEELLGGRPVISDLLTRRAHPRRGLSQRDAHSLHAVTHTLRRGGV